MNQALEEEKLVPYLREIFWKEQMTYNFTEEYDIIVIGAGHAGVEASLAVSHYGLQGPACDHQYWNASFHAL